MNLTTNPSAVRVFVLIGGFLVLIALAGLFYAIVLFRRRSSQQEGAERPSSSLRPDGFALATFQQTIEELKRRQQELEKSAREAAERANSGEALLRAFVDGLSLPAILFNSVGLVQTASAGARELFGYASLSGFGVKDLFGSSTLVVPQENPEVPVPDLIREALHSNQPLRDVRITCETRAVGSVVLDVSVVPGARGGIVLANPAPTNGACTDVVPPNANSPCSSGQ